MRISDWSSDVCSSDLWDPQRSFKRDDNFVLASLSGDIDLGDDIELNTISSYSRIRLARPVDLDGTPFTSVFIVNGGRLESISQEMRISGVDRKSTRLNSSH